jgi:hypothetical protein
MGVSPETIAAKLKEIYPEVNIVKKWDKFVAFRGGDSVAQGSHFGVEFNFEKPVDTE